jgi:hypothetical protein
MAKVARQNPARSGRAKQLSIRFIGGLCWKFADSSKTDKAFFAAAAVQTRFAFDLQIHAFTFG